VKELIDRLQKSNLVFKKITFIDIKKEFNSRKKIKLYLGINLNGYYSCIIDINKKSCILQKEALELMEFHKKLEAYNGTRIKRKYIYINQTPICSKAKALLIQEGWVILRSILK
jgi:hypothetical protein